MNTAGAWYSGGTARINTNGSMSFAYGGTTQIVENSGWYGFNFSYSI